MSLLERPAIQRVLGHADVRFTRPSFKFDFRHTSLYEAGGTFIPPVSHAKPREPFTIHVKSDRGGIVLQPFQVQDTFPERTAHVCGGVVIAIGGKDRLVLVSSEYPLYGMVDYYLGADSTQSLIKTDLNDFDVVVEPIQGQHNGHPYVLENDYDGRLGLLLKGKGLDVIDNGGQVLVRRM